MNNCKEVSWQCLCTTTAGNWLWFMHVWSLAYSLSRHNLPLAFSTSFLPSKQRVSSPQKLKVMQTDASAIDGLSIFPFLNSTSILDGLKAELPTHLAKSVDIDPKFSCLEWWKQIETALPCSSAAASECVFSLLNASFNKQEHHSLQDYAETSVMLQYSKH